MMISDNMFMNSSLVLNSKDYDICKAYIHNNKENKYIKQKKLQ